MSDKIKLFELLNDNEGREVLREIVEELLKIRNIEPTKEKVEKIVNGMFEALKNKGV